MTADEESALLASVAQDLETRLQAALGALLGLIRGGTAPRDATQQVLQSFGQDLAAELSAAMSAIVGAAVPAAEIMALQVAGVSLSGRLFAQAADTSAVVSGIVQAHVGGFQDARKLALELFEGYEFRPPDAEPLQMSPQNPRLPRYLREALLSEDTLQGQMQRAFARIQVDKLSTPALRAAYTDLLDAIDGMEGGAGAKLLDRRLQTAFFERMRYFANRIAQTELHRAYARREALLLMQDDDVDFVQIRRAPDGPTCICTLYAGRNLYGLGPGVYPKRMAPVPPYHPFCRCVMAPRLDLTGRKEPPREAAEDVSFLRRLGSPLADRVVGSKAKLEDILRGLPVDQVTQAGRNPQYRVRNAGDVAAGG